MATVYKITQTVTGNSSSSWAEDGSDPTQPSGIDGSESEFAKDFYSMVAHFPIVMLNELILNLSILSPSSIDMWFAAILA